MHAVSPTHALWQTFLDAGPDPQRPARAAEVVAAQEAVEAQLVALWRDGAAAWPGLVLAPPALARHLGRCWPLDSAALAFLTAAAPRAADLYLACACAVGDAAALATFEQHLLVEVGDYVAHLDRSPAFADEVRQALRERLLWGGGGAPPRIASFGGRGSLRGFVRATALRLALTRLRGRRADEGLDDQVLRAVAPAPEVALLRAQHQDLLRAALREAFLALPRAHRLVLRLHHGGGLAWEEIAALLKVDRSTVGRRLQAARATMLQRTRRALAERLGVPAQDLDSLLAILCSQLELDLVSLLRDPQEASALGEERAQVGAEEAVPPDQMKKNSAK